MGPMQLHPEQPCPLQLATAQLAASTNRRVFVAPCFLTRRIVRPRYAGVRRRGCAPFVFVLSRVPRYVAVVQPATKDDWALGADGSFYSDALRRDGPTQHVLSLLRAGQMWLKRSQLAPGLAGFGPFGHKPANAMACESEKSRWWRQAVCLDRRRRVTCKAPKRRDYLVGSRLALGWPGFRMSRGDGCRSSGRRNGATQSKDVGSNGGEVAKRCGL